jgi:hypothetical protein
MAKVVEIHDGHARRTPQEMVREIAHYYTEEERREFVQYIGAIAKAELNPTYATPHVANAGFDALKLAVGLQELPQEEGDN